MFASKAVVVAVFGSFATSAVAQIATDGSLPGRGAQPFSGSQVSIPSEAGVQRGGNLFHSFKDFNVRAGQTVDFVGGNEPVSRVIARVTGGSITRIDGTLNNIEGASLFLVNRAGIVVGPAGQINVTGSLALTTADYIGFADGTRFGAIPGTNDVLSAAPPSAFGFLHSHSGRIRIEGQYEPIPDDPDGNTQANALFTPEGASLSIIGGAASFSTRIVSAPGGQLNVVAVASPGQVRVDPDSGVLTKVTNPRLGSIEMSEFAILDATGFEVGGGNIFVRGGTVGMSGAAEISTFGQFDVGGSIDVISDALTMSGEAAIYTGGEVEGSGGAVRVNVGTLTMSEAAEIQAYTSGSGAGGTVRVDVTKLHIEGGGSDEVPTGIISETYADGNAGNVQVNVGESLTILDAGIISSTTFGPGNGGSVTVDAPRAAVTIDGVAFPRRTGIAANSQNLPENEFPATGDAGTVRVTANSILIQRGGGIGSDSIYAGAGAGGNVIIRTNTLTLDGADTPVGTGINTLSGSQFDRDEDGTNEIYPGGPGGLIDVEVRESLSIRGAFTTIRANTFGEANAGTVRVKSRQIQINGVDGRTTGIGAEVEQNASGNGGTLTVEADTIDVNAGRIAVSTLGSGNAGTLNILSRSMVLSNGSVVESASESTGNGGDIIAAASESLMIETNASISARAVQANAGSVTINSPTLVVRESSITTDSQGLDAGTGGDIGVNGEVLVLDGSIVTSAVAEDAGNISLNVSNFISSPASVLNANSELAAPGTIAVSGQIVDVSGALIALPSSVFTQDLRLQASCLTLTRYPLSSFTVSGQGGLRQR